MTIPASFAAAILTASLLCSNASATTRLAPADEYFGHMKMSVLEIGNRLNDLHRRANAPLTSQDMQSIMHDAGLTEDAIRDWKRKYPADPWLVKDIVNLKKIYAQTRQPHKGVM